MNNAQALEITYLNNFTILREDEKALVRVTIFQATRDTVLNKADLLVISSAMIFI